MKEFKDLKNGDIVYRVEIRNGETPLLDSLIVTSIHRFSKRNQMYMLVTLSYNGNIVNSILIKEPILNTAVCCHRNMFKPSYLFIVSSNDCSKTI